MTVHLFIFAQSELTAQLVLHARATASHAKGIQGICVVCLHIPPRQVGTGCRRSFPSHMAVPQIVPSVIGEQVPSLPGIAHELQLGHAAEPQQKPSVQWPLMHCVFELQTVPFGWRLVHEYPRHMNPGAQSATVVQVVLHATRSQT